MQKLGNLSTKTAKPKFSKICQKSDFKNSQIYYGEFENCGQTNLTLFIWKVLLFWKFWYAAQQDRSKIGFLADFWKFWFCCFSTKVAHLWHFFRNFRLDSFRVFSSCCHVSWSIGTPLNFLVVDTKGYQKNVSESNYTSASGPQVSHKMDAPFFWTEEVYI